MKKLLIISTFLISTLFFINNVSALDIIVEPYFDFDSIDDNRFHAIDNSSIDFHFPDISTIPEEKQDNYNLALQYLESKCGDYDSFAIVNGGYTSYGYDNQIELLCFNQANNKFIPSVSLTASYDGTKYINISIYYNLYKSDSNNYYYARFIKNGTIEENLSLNDNTVSRQFYYDGWYSYSHSNFPILKSNIDFLFNNNYPTNVNLLSSFKYNDVIYNIGDFGYKNGVLYDKSKDITPTITITKENEEITTVNDVDYITAINLNVSSNANDEDYICMFSFDERETWDKYSCSEAYAYKAKENKTYYAQVVDRATESVVSSTTFTITDIQIIPSSNPMVDITIEKIEYNNVDFVAGGSCIVNKNNEKYKVCEDLKITFSILDENLFKYQYSYDNKNWNDFEFNILDKSDYSNSMTIRLYQNTTLYVRVINLDNNQLNNSKTFTITQITQIESTNQQVNFQSVYYKELMKIDVYVTFLNYDHTNYNYYFNTSSDKNSFLNITNNITCSIESGCKYKHTFDYSGTVYIRIEDKQGNYINAFTYTVSYEHYLTNKTINDYMSDIPSFMNHFTKYIKSFTNAISYFFNSLNPTIKIAIISLFIVLVACCIIKLGRK